MNDTSSRGVWEWAIVKLILFLCLLLFGGFIAFEGYAEEGIRLIIRWSARISITCFCIAFAGKYFHLRVRNSFSFWIYMNRRYWGITFAIIHLIHLAFLGVLQYSFHPVFEKAAATSLLAGGLAYVFVVLMLLTSFEAFSKLLSDKQWRILHTVGGYWILFIFSTSYTKGVLRGEYWDLIFLSMIVGVLLLRLLGSKVT